MQDQELQKNPPAALEAAQQLSFRFGNNPRFNSLASIFTCLDVLQNIRGKTQIFGNFTTLQDCKIEAPQNHKNVFLHPSRVTKIEAPKIINMCFCTPLWVQKLRSKKTPHFVFCTPPGVQKIAKNHRNCTPPRVQKKSSAKVKP